ncbi:MAG: hypothetical protein LUQ39_02520 [Methanomassiliicoccales archaeon]|nr:hypothetical protein [Methanomassiliicoccales archaeon]
MKGRKNDRRALASIMDAFLFLLAMIALGTFLVGNSNDGWEMSDDDWQVLVDRTHAVIASITLRLPDDEGYEEGAPCVEITSLIQLQAGGEYVGLPEWAMTQARAMIAGLLGSGWGFEWIVICGETRQVLVSSNASTIGAEVFASTIGGSGENDGRYDLILRAWRS